MILDYPRNWPGLSIPAAGLYTLWSPARKPDLRIGRGEFHAGQGAALNMSGGLRCS